MKKRLLSDNILIVQKKIKVSEININDLPIDILSLILSQTNYSMMFHVKLVCKKWLKASNKHSFYQEMLKDYCYCNQILKFNIPVTKYILRPDFLINKSWPDIFNFKKLTGEENCTKKLGTILVENIGFYEGELLNGKRHGRGILYKNGTGIMYIGDFHKEQATGNGTRYWSNGDTYTGSFVDSKKNGHGILKFVLENKCQGEYHGSFQNDKKHGSGKLIFSDNDVYDGMWENDMANGYGIFTSPTFFYEGLWKDNKKHGHGILRYKNGVYTGEFNNNAAHGKGIMEFKSGKKYDGSFVNNNWNGQGCYYASNGTKYVGEFRNTKINGNCIVYDQNNNMLYSGHFVNNHKHGMGIEYYQNKYRYEGSFKKDVRSGHGKIFDTDNKLIIEGIFKNNELVKKIFTS